MGGRLGQIEFINFRRQFAMQLRKDTIMHILELINSDDQILFFYQAGVDTY